MVDKSVGLIVMVDVPGIGLVAVLRERGFFNPEEMKPESWPGACQVTAHGGLKEGEDFLSALLREVSEELGNDFALHFSLLIAVNPTTLGKVSHCQNGEKEVVTFAIKMDSLLLRKIRFGPESGSIRLVSLEETSKIADIASFDRVVGVQDRKIIAMFPDEKQAVVSAFALVCS